MGLLSGLLLLPLSGPVWGFRLFLERLREEADAVLYDEGRSFGELIDLSMRHKAGKLTDAEFAEQEAAVLDRLRSMRDYRDELLEAEQEMEVEQYAEAEQYMDAEQYTESAQFTDEAEVEPELEEVEP
jgi:Gas vesicle protein G